MLCIRHTVDKGLWQGREVHELYTDLMKDCAAVRSVVLLGASTKLRKSSIRFVLSVCMSFHMEKLDCHWNDVHRIWYLSISSKFAKKIQIPFKSDKKNGYHYNNNSLSFSKVGNISYKFRIENQNTFYVKKYCPTIRALHEIMWNNLLDSDRPQIAM